MRKLRTTTYAAIFAVAAGSFAGPATASPWMKAPAPAPVAGQQAEIQKVGGMRRGRGDRRDRRAGSRRGRGDNWRMREGRPYWRGHRGYRERRSGYREYNGWWFPPAAFALGAIIGGAARSNPGYAGGLPAAHYAWCEDRYRSYRASDNTFQPYNGPRQQCNSPYV